jgi:hypothetical protein
MVALVVGCTNGAGPTVTTAAPSPVTTTAGASTELPVVRALDLGEGAFASHSLIEIIVDLEADYDNPFDQREVSLDGVFTGPGDSTVHLPGSGTVRVRGNSVSRPRPTENGVTR